MAAQTTYTYDTPKAIAGQIADIAFGKVVKSRTVESNDGVVRFGTAVVAGTNAGAQVKVPAAGATAIEGVVLHTHNVEENADGVAIIKKGTVVNVMSKGHVWARLASTDKTAPTAGAKAYVVIASDVAGDIGTFTATEVANKTIEAGVFGNKVDLASGIVEVDFD